MKHFWGLSLICQFVSFSSCFTTNCKMPLHQHQIPPPPHMQHRLPHPQAVNGTSSVTATGSNPGGGSRMAHHHHHHGGIPMPPPPVMLSMPPPTVTIPSGGVITTHAPPMAPPVNSHMHIQQFVHHHSP